MNVNQTNKKEEILEAYKAETEKNKKLMDAMEKLLARVEKLENSTVATPTLTTTPSVNDANRIIKVISLFDGTLNLATRADGNGKVVKFTGFGQDRQLIASDLIDIVHNNWRFFEIGYAYIDDEDFAKSYGLSEVYANLLDKETIDKLLDLGAVPMLNMFKSAPKAQQEVIVSVIVSKLTKHQDLDLNKVYKISEVYGKDLVEMARDNQFLELDKK